MGEEKLFKIIIMDLSTDNLKLEAELERVINSGLDTTEKTLKIKWLLSEIVTTEAMLAKFTSMVSNNNDEKK